MLKKAHSLFSKKILRFLLFIPFLVFLFLAPQLFLMLRYSPKIYSQVEALSTKKYGIIFGARVYKNNRLTDVVRERTEAAVELYRQKKIEILYVSGDNSNNAEADAIAAYANKIGIPKENIIVDPNGINTEETCRNAKATGINEATLITQRYHLFRSMYMCERLGIQTQGIAANNLAILENRGSDDFEIFRIRILRYLREALLTWTHILGLYGPLSRKGELL
jgi:vancomycin permeability regulator SanA